MLFECARPMGRVLTTAVAAALMAAALPAQAAPPRLSAARRALVFNQVDVAATGTVSPARVEPGAPATFTFLLVNQGSGDADNVRLEVLLPVRPGDVRPDARCAAVARGRWACPMGALAAGGSVQASFTVVPRTPAVIGATGTAFAD